MRKYTIGTCGYYDTEHTIVNGQTLRSLTVTELLSTKLGKEKMKCLDYSVWRKKPFSTMLAYLNLFFCCKNVIIFPDENAVRLFIPIAAFFRTFLRTKIFYVVIGGWLPVFLTKHRLYEKYLKKFDGLFVQTKTIQNALYEKKIQNVFILPNFRNININNRLFSQSDKRNTLFTTIYLSRIEEKKGVAEMIEVVKRINAESVVCTLDIFGPIQNGYEDEFKLMCENFPQYIRYCGVLGSNEINGIISSYDLQLFPTKYRTEGFPGSVLDSFYAGVPVLAADWNSSRDIIENNVDGVLFEFDNYNDMYNKLNMIISDNDLINRLKIGCRNKGELFFPDKIITDMMSHIEV